MEPGTPQNRAKMEPQTPKIKPKWGPDGVGKGKESEKDGDGNKKQAACHRVPPFFPKKWPRWPQLGPQNGAKMVQKSMQKSIKILVVSGIGFWSDFGGFLEPKWSQVGAKMGSKIDINFEERFFKNNWKTIEKSMIFGFPGDEVGSKNRSKMESKMEGILTSIFGRF